MSETEATRKLRSYVERIERLQEDRKAIGDDIADLFRELDGDGFDKQAVKAILKIRSADDGLAIWTERSATVDLYLSSLGMLAAPAPARTREIIEEFAPRRASERPVDGLPATAQMGPQAVTAGETAPLSNPAIALLPDAAGQTVEVVAPPAASTVAHSRQVNPNCRKAAAGQPCALSHSMASCSICAQAALKSRVAA